MVFLEKLGIIILFIISLSYNEGFCQLNEGQIKRVKGDTIIVTNSMGWEFSTGQDVIIMRTISGQHKKIATGRVYEANNTTTFIQVLNRTSEFQIKRGDWVTSQIEDYSSFVQSFTLPKNFIKFKGGYSAISMTQINKYLIPAFKYFEVNGMPMKGQKFPEGSLTAAIEYGRTYKKYLKGSISLDYLTTQLSLSEDFSTRSLALQKSIHNLNLVLNVIFCYESFFQRYKLYAGAGVGISYATMASKIVFTDQLKPLQNINSTGDYYCMRVTEQAFVGLELPVSKSWGVSLATHYRFRRLWFIDSEFSGDNKNAPPARLWNYRYKIREQEIDLEGGAVLIGMVYYF
ncbi:hypothetical protein JW964_11255 [candidate division KSB1 bacterium]|nr:hypothetical protein [candidate division KSB1 bacterium]